MRRKVNEYSTKHLYKFRELFIVAIKNKFYKVTIEELIVRILSGFFKELNQRILITLLN